MNNDSPPAQYNLYLLITLTTDTTRRENVCASNKEAARGQYHGVKHKARLPSRVEAGSLIEASALKRYIFLVSSPCFTQFRFSSSFTEIQLHCLSETWKLFFEDDQDSHSVFSFLLSHMATKSINTKVYSITMDLSPILYLVVNPIYASNVEERK